jgi:hypothetical protein
MKTRLLKFDIVHPVAYLERAKRERGDLAAMSLAEYRTWLIGLRSNYSDFYTHWLNETGEWEAEEFFLLDPVFLNKVVREVFDGPTHRLKARVAARAKGWTWTEAVIAAYVEHFCPDAIFARSNPIRSAFWPQMGALNISRLSARLPWNWHPEHFDLLFVDDPVFREFFQMHGVRTLLNRQGIDPRIPGELAPRSARFATTFVGGLGVRNFARRTRFLAELAARTELDLWGYWWDETGPQSSIQTVPVLAQRFHGVTSGLEMYQIFRDSAVVVNDYVDLDTHTGIGYNQRMFEVMGAGGFLLTRAARNLSADFPAGIFVTYECVEDCIDKIAYFTRNTAERDEIAAAGRAHVLENASFRDIALDFGREVRRSLDLREQRGAGPC